MLNGKRLNSYSMDKDQIKPLSGVHAELASMTRRIEALERDVGVKIPPDATNQRLLDNLTITQLLDDAEDHVYKPNVIQTVMAMIQREQVAGWSNVRASSHKRYNIELRGEGLRIRKVPDIMVFRN